MELRLYKGGDGCGSEVRIRFPAEPDAVWEAISELEQYGAGDGSVRIEEAVCPVANLTGYVRCADLEEGADIQKLNLLALRISGMSQQDHRLFYGALNAESINGLDDILRIASNLGQYEMIEGVTSDRALGGWLVEHDRLNVKFPREVQPYLDYAAIGAEYYSNHGGAYTPNGYVKQWEDALAQEETPRAMLLTLTTSKRQYDLSLPATNERLEQAKRMLDVEDFAQAGITGVRFSSPYLGDLLPLDSITVEDANTLALCLQEMEQEDGALMKYCAVLEVEQPGTFAKAINIAMDRDDYELVPEDMDEYGRQVLRRAGADDEIMDTIDGFMDFAGLGEMSIEEDGVRRTVFGLVRRLSTPFPPEQEIGMQMQ